MRILIVDDSPDIRALFIKRLSASGYADLLTASSACEAFRVLGLKEANTPDPPIDLILMDITMPGIDGIEACRRIKAASHLGDIPIIMVTAHDEPGYIAAAHEAGAADYIKKSANKSELGAAVERQLGVRH